MDDLRRRRLKLSRLADMNDPFECLSAALPTKKRRMVEARGYRKPQLKDCGTVELMTQDTCAGWPPEGEGDNIVWGSFAPEHRDVIETDAE